ncbi:oligosaccharide flippase family protein [Rhizobium sp. ZPR3]|uniref:Oligosaccharide flippase family protein n=2 Tax=unclassified Rhizobium TaxID=2613769 RepID=A0AAU7SRT7_9HYPH
MRNIAALNKLGYQRVVEKYRYAGSRTFYAAICGMLSAVATYFSGAIAARALGPAAIGEFYLAVQIVSYLTLAAGLGLTEIAQREVARNPQLKNRFLWLVISIQLPLSVLFVFFSITVNTVTGYIDNKLWYIIVGLAFANCANISWFLQAVKHTTFVFVSTLFLDVALVFTCSFFVRAPGDIYMYALLYVSVQVLKVCFLIIYTVLCGIGIQIRKLSLRGSGALIVAAAPNALSYVSILIYYNSDAFVINYYFDEATVGKYTAAYALMLMLTAPCFAILKVHFGLLSEVARSSDAMMKERSRAFLRILSFIGAPLAALGVFFAQTVFAAVYGEKFSDGWVYFQYLSLNLLLIYINVGYAKPLIAWGFQRAHMLITLSSAVLNVLLNFSLIPHFGALGAVHATIISELFVFFAVWGVRTYYDLARFSLVRAIAFPISCSFLFAYIGKIIFDHGG